MTKIDELVSVRQAYVNTLIELAQVRDDFVLFDADSKEATMINQFSAKYPDRSYSFGIAEQNMVSAAAGLATMGIIPIVHTYAMFIAARALDQVINSVAYTKENVKLVVSHHGLDVGPDGVTHQVTEDIAIMRAIPNIVVLSPADAVEVREMVKFMLAYDGPVYLRLGKSKVKSVMPTPYHYELGTPTIVKEGADLTVFSHGAMLTRVLAFVERVEVEKNISIRVVNASTLKPVNERKFIELLGNTKAVITVEDHSPYGGLGGVIAEIIVRNHLIPMECIAVKDVFAEAGTPDELFNKYGISFNDFTNSVERALGRIK